MRTSKRSLALAIVIACGALPAPLPAAAQQKPNILVIFGDDIGVTNVSAYGLGVVAYRGEVQCR